MDTAYLIITLVALIILLLLGSAMSASETALTSANKLRLQYLSEKGNRRAKTASDVSSDTDRLLTALLIGLNIVVIVSTSLVTAFFIKLFGSKGILISAIVWTVITLIFGDIIPKTIAAKIPVRSSLRLATFVKILIVLLTPFTWIFKKISNVTIYPIVKKLKEDEPSVTEEDIKSLASLGEREGIIEELEKEIIHNVLEFTDSVVHEVMVPRVDMIGVDKNATTTEVIKTIKESGHSRIPVFEDDIDNIIGVIYAKDILTYAKEGKELKIIEIMRPVHFVPETKKIVELLAEMQKLKVHIAVALDEYGGTSGLVTVEDLLEEIVGEIQDEYDQELPKIVKIDENNFLIGGGASIEEVIEETGLPVSQGEFDTMGGFIFSYIGRVPKQGEEIKINDYKITVTSVISKRIAQVKLTKPSVTSDDL
jgi:CBS domain containing-hemolysin-like protein